MITDLYIYDEGDDFVRKIDLFDDEKISITSSIQNVNDISKVFTDYSQSFTVPASDNNNQIFKNWYESSLDNGFDVRRKYNGYIEIDTQVFRTGQWQLESASVKDNRIEDYKLTFYGNLISLTEKFGEDKLKDIEELNDYSILYNGTNVRNLVQNNVNTDVAFPLISSNRVWQYSGGSADNITNSATPIFYPELFPALKIARIFDAIKDKYNINFNGNFLTQSRFTEAFLWLKNKENFSPMSQNVLVNFTETFNNLPANFAGLYLQGDKFYIKTDSIAGEQIYNNNAMTSSFYTFNFSPNVIWKITILKDNQPFSVFSGTGSTTGPLSFPDQQGTYKMYLSTNVACTWNMNLKHTTIYFNGSLHLLFYKLANSSGTISSVYLDIPSYMPDMKVSDFFSGILKMFNLTCFSFDEQNYTLEQLEQWYYQGFIKDYSEYCTTDLEFERIKPYKKINFEFEKSESLMNRAYYDNAGKEYGDLSSSFNTDGSDYTIKLPFENILFNKFTGTSLQVGYSINKDLKPYIPKPVILYRSSNYNTGGIYFNNGSTTSLLNTYNKFGQDVYYQNQLHSMNWGVEISSFFLSNINNSLFKDYYFDYLNNLYSLKSRMVKVSMRLPYPELLSLRLNDRIVIRDKRYIINSFTTDLDTYESKMELIQDFRTLVYNNAVQRQTDNSDKTLKFDTVSNEPLTWSILDDPNGQIVNITNGSDYVEVEIKDNFTATELIYSIISNLNDIIIITQDA